MSILHKLHGKSSNCLGKFELNAAVFALVFCIHMLIDLLVIAISPKWSMALLYICNGNAGKVTHILNKSYSGWQFVQAGWWLYLIGTIILFVVINVKISNKIQN